MAQGGIAQRRPVCEIGVAPINADEFLIFLVM
jgi:hypothetical protein